MIPTFSDDRSYFKRSYFHGLYFHDPNYSHCVLLRERKVRENEGRQVNLIYTNIILC